MFRERFRDQLKEEVLLGLGEEIAENRPSIVMVLENKSSRKKAKGVVYMSRNDTWLISEYGWFDIGRVERNIWIEVEYVIGLGRAKHLRGFGPCCKSAKAWWARSDDTTTLHPHV